MPNEAYVYGIVLIALSVIVSLFMTIGKPIIKLNSTLTEILTKMETVQNQVSTFSKDNRESHRRLHSRINTVEEDVNELKLQMCAKNKS